MMNTQTGMETLIFRVAAAIEYGVPVEDIIAKFSDVPEDTLFLAYSAARILVRDREAA